MITVADHRPYRVGVLFDVLGPLRVSGADGVVSLPGGRSATALAWLVLHANQPVSIDWLAGELWPDRAENAPVKARMLLRGLIPLVGSSALQVDAQARLVVSDDAIDAWRFEQLVRQGRDHLRRGDGARARANLDAALALWRAEPYPELDRAVAAIGDIDRLVELRLVAVEEATSLALRGQVDYALVADLRALVVRHPERARLRRQLAVALYRTGRQVEALDSMAATMRELGDDGGETAALRAAILQHDDRLTHGELRPH